MKKEINENSVIQANENAGEWAGCLLQVDEVKSWGVQAYVKIPKSGDAYIRLTSSQFEYIGEAILIPKKE